MSQAGIINIVDNNPTIPIYFEADTGFAVALFNVIHIVGAGGITTSATGNTITINGNALSTDLHNSTLIVGDTTNGANYASLSAAMAAAMAGQTIFMQPGTYNIGTQAWTSGVNICAFSCDAFTPNVILNGTLTYSDTGAVSASGIQFMTNSANIFQMSGANASKATFINCVFNCTSATGITNTCSNTSSSIVLINCAGSLGTTGIGIINQTGASNFTTNKCRFTNIGGSTTGDTFSAGTANYFFTNFNHPVTTSSTASAGFNFVKIDTGAQNVTCLNLNGSTHSVANCTITSSAASAITVGSASTVSCSMLTCNSTATNVITGSGIINMSPVAMVGTSSNINTTTQNSLPFTYGHSAGNSGTFTSNSMKDYEEGTFVPTIQGQATGGTTTYTSQVGYYTRIGRMVSVSLFVSWSAATGTGVIRVMGLPFTANSNVAQFPMKMYSTVFSLAGATEFMPIMGGGGNTIVIFGINASPAPVTRISSDLTANQNALLYINGVYFV